MTKNNILDFETPNVLNVITYNSDERIKDPNNDMRKEIIDKVLRRRTKYSQDDFAVGTRIRLNGENIMNENDWEKQYISSLDRNIAEIRKESSDNRREMKEDMRAYVNQIQNYVELVNTKFDTSINAINELKSEYKELKQDINEEVRAIKSDNSDTKRWILGVGISIIIAIIGFAMVVIFKA